MHTSQPDRAPRRPAFLILAALAILGAVGVVVSTAQDIELGVAGEADGLSDAETAYYEFVAPRLDRLVLEVDDVVVMVEGKSRDILALTISGSRIENLTADITRFGELNGVPDRFRGVHETILDATGTATYTFDQARESLRTFEFSRMTGLVVEFQDAADGLHQAQDEMNVIAGGTEDA